MFKTLFFHFAAGLLLFPCLTTAQASPHEPGEFVEDFSYRVASPHDRELEDKAIAFPLLVSAHSKKDPAPLTFLFEEGQTDVLIDISHISLVSSEYDPSNAVILEVRAAGSLVPEFLYHGAHGQAELVSAGILRISKPLEESVLVYLREVPGSLSLKIYPEAEGPVTSAHMEIAAVRQLKDPLPESLRFGAVDICAVSGINIFLDASLSFEKERRASLTASISDLLQKSRLSKDIEINFYTMYENSISGPVQLVHSGGEENPGQGLKSKIDGLPDVQGGYLEWTGLREFTKDESRLNILFTDGIPNGKGGKRVHPLKCLDDIQASGGCMIVNASLEHEERGFLGWYDIEAFTAGLEGWLGQGCEGRGDGEEIRGLSISPNPVKAGNSITIKGGTTTQVSVRLEGRIADLYGNTFQRFSFDTAGGAFEQAVLLGNVAAGVYIIEIRPGRDGVPVTVKLSVL